jgi:predicted transcriptional regulator
MGRTPQDITEKELEILQTLWEQGPATIRQLTDRLYPGGGPAKYATVQTLLVRLEKDGHVCRDRAGPVHVYSAATGRDDVIGRRLRDVAEQLCDGSLTPLLTHLVRTSRLTSKQRQELRNLIDELDQKGKPRDPRR